VILDGCRFGQPAKQAGFQNRPHKTRMSLTAPLFCEPARAHEFTVLAKNLEKIENLLRRGICLVLRAPKDLRDFSEIWELV